MVLFEENGVRVSLLRSERSYDNICQWYLAIVNDTDQDIALGLTDITVDGQAREKKGSPLYLTDTNLGAHQKTVCKLSCTVRSGETMPQNVGLRLWIMDFKKESILYTGQQEILLQIPELEEN